MPRREHMTAAVDREAAWHPRARLQAGPVLPAATHQGLSWTHRTPYEKVNLRIQASG
jgi:hypothetical protein